MVARAADRERCAKGKEEVLDGCEIEVARAGLESGEETEGVGSAGEAEDV